MNLSLGSILLAATTALFLTAADSGTAAAPAEGTIDPYSGKPCALCHQSKVAGPGLHPALAGNRCTPCHKLSNGNHTRDHRFSEVKDRTSRLCYGCHPDQTRRQSVHAPVMEGNCLVCHAPHSSPNRSLLKLPWPRLCFDCHDTALESAGQTDKATAFRDGRQNLHNLHLRKGKIPCLTCHQAHAGSQDRLLRTTWGSGLDKGNLTFRVTPTGGSCTSSCHAEISYARKP